MCSNEKTIFFPSADRVDNVFEPCNEVSWSFSNVTPTSLYNMCSEKTCRGNVQM